MTEYLLFTFATCLPYKLVMAYYVPQCPGAWYMVRPSVQGISPPICDSSRIDPEHGLLDPFVLEFETMLSVQPDLK